MYVLPKAGVQQMLSMYGSLNLKCSFKVCRSKCELAHVIIPQSVLVGLAVVFTVPHLALLRARAPHRLSERRGFGPSEVVSGFLPCPFPHIVNYGPH